MPDAQTGHGNDELPMLGVMRQQLESCGDILSNSIHHLQFAIGGSGERTDHALVSVVNELKKFSLMVSRVTEHAGEKGGILQAFQSSVSEYVHRLEGLGKDGDVDVFSDVLQYELIPLLSGWDGVKNGLLDYLGE